MASTDALPKGAVPAAAYVVERASARNVRIDVDLAAVRHNLTEARRLSGGGRLFAVVKADAYGHGALAVARALSRTDLPAAARADGFAVVTSGEAMALRDSGVRQPILVLQGPCDPDDVERFVKADLWPVIHDLAQHRWYRVHARRGELRAWLKVDTGMGRLGVRPDEVAALLRAGDGIRWHGVLSHLACADEPDNAHTHGQIRRFDELDVPHGLERSLANSAAVIGWPSTRHDWGRPGLMLYGCDPRVPEAMDGRVDETGGEPGDESHIGARRSTSEAPPSLQPAMRVTSTLLSVKTMEAGAGVGYAQTWHCPERMPIGLARVGYADGLPRVLDERATMSVHGVDCPVVGRVSMDSVALDLRGAAQAVPGDPVELWGKSRPVDALAASAGTIAYEMLTSIRGERRHADGVLPSQLC